MNAFKIAILLMLLPFLPGCGNKVEVDPNVLVQIGSREIRTEQFLLSLKQRKIDTEDGKVALLNELIDTEAMAERAREMGLDKDPEVVRSYRNLLIGMLRKRELESKLKEAVPDDDEIRHYYNDHFDDYTMPTKRRGALIYVETLPTMTKERRAAAKERAIEIRSEAIVQVEEGQEMVGFGSLSVKYSEHQISRYKGGDIGWHEEGGLTSHPSAVLDALFSLEKKGDVSGVIKTEVGYYIVKLLDEQSASVLSEEKAREVIRKKLLRENQRRIEADFKQQARSSVNVRIFDEALKGIVLPDSESSTLRRPPALQ